MPRSLALVRVLSELRHLQGSHLGVTIDELAADARVSTRTVRRDLAALQQAGVPLYDERATKSAPKRWRVLDGRKEAA